MAQLITHTEYTGSYGDAPAVLVGGPDFTRPWALYLTLAAIAYWYLQRKR